MKNKYQIKRNYNPPSSEQIREKMDFASLMERYEKEQSMADAQSSTPIIRPMWYRRLGVAAAVALLLGVAFQFLRPDYYKKQQQHFANQSYVNPPKLESATASFASYRVDANQGGVIEHHTGSKLRFPEKAFVYPDGQDVEGEVNIMYREMHDFVDFFLSGIPMTYDSLNTTYDFESAGMIEVYAEKEGKRINMRPGKSISLELVSVVNVPDLVVPPSFNIYKLNESERAWEYQAPDDLQYLESVPMDIPEDHIAFEAQNDYTQKIQQIQKTKEVLLEDLTQSTPLPKEPIRPKAQAEDRPSFSLSFPQSFKNRQPELYAEYKNAVWQFHSSESRGGEILRAESWKDMELIPLTAQDFELKLVGQNNNTASVLITSILIGPEYDRAIVNYERKHEAYKSAMETWESTMATQRQAIEKKAQDDIAKAEEQFQATLQTLAQDNPIAMKGLMPRKRVISSFTADEFGVWNCDRPVLPKRVQFKANFKLPNGRNLQNVTAYLATRGENTIHQFLMDKSTPMHINLNQEHLIWVVLENQKIAILRPKDLKAINEDSKKQNFEMQIIESASIEAQSLRSILKFS